MKVSTKVECGIIALIDIAVNSAGGGIVKVTAISQRNNISAKYLEQILPLLKQSKLISSVKGASGGYVLTRSASEITLREIINTLDNTILSEAMFSEKLEPAAVSAISERLWEPVNSYMQSFADSLTLRQLAERFTEIQSNRAEELMYYI